MPELYRRIMTLPVDDTDPHFLYQGSWEEVKGSSRQWNAGVMTTQQPGASVSFTFFGSDAILYHTIPSGSGNVVVEVSVDGGAPTTVTNACGGANPVFHDVFFQTPVMADTTHTIVVTNMSPASIPFQFDRADLQSHDTASMLLMQSPTILPLPPTSTSSLPLKVQSTPVSVSPGSSTTPRLQSVAPTSLSPAQTGVAPNLQSKPSTNLLSPSAANDETFTGRPGAATPASGVVELVTSVSSQLSTVRTIVTTDAFGSTVTRTEAVEGTSISALLAPSETLTPNSNETPGQRTPTPIMPIVLGAVLGTIAFLLLMLMAFLCVRRQKRAPGEEVSAPQSRGLGFRSRALDVIPNPFQHKPVLPPIDSLDEYPVGYTAIYRDEKRNHTFDSLDSPVGSYSSSSLNVSQSSPLQAAGMTSPIPNPFDPDILCADEESTVVEAAPPAYHIDLVNSQRTSLGTSFYV